jgi:Mg-chelatase subunit ChlD
MQKEPPDLLIVLDSSGSMGGHKIGTPTYYATLAAMKAAAFVLKRGRKVAVINFSSETSVLSFRHKIEEIEEHLLIYRGESTFLPGFEIFQVTKETPNAKLVLIITDSEIWNFSQQKQLIRQIAQNHYLALFCIGNTKENEVMREIKEQGEIHFIRRPEDLFHLVVRCIRRQFFEENRF